MAVIEAIETIYLEADVASVEFASLGSYEHLQLRMNGATNSTSFSGTYRDVALLYFNTSVATANSDYSQHAILARDTGINAYATATQHYWSAAGSMGTSKDAEYYGGAVVDILDYRNGSKNTTMMVVSGGLGPDSSGATEFVVNINSGSWDNVAAVTKILLIPDLGTAFKRGSVFSLYGIQE